MKKCLGSSSFDTRERIDCHVHLIAFDRKKHGSFYRGADRKDFLYTAGRIFYGFHRKMPFCEMDEAYADLLARMVRESRYCDRVVLLANDGLYDERGRLDPRTECVVSNDWTARVVKRYPDVFLFGASIHPNRKDALEELEKCFREGAVCVKWIPPSQNIDPSDIRYVPFYENMLKHGLVLLSHTGYEHSLSTTNQHLGDPERLRLPLELGLTVVAAHSGASGWYHPVEYFPNFLRLLEKFDNLFGDSAAFTSPERFTYRKWILSSEFIREKIIQGTDFPTPPLPILWAGTLGFRKALKIQFMRNIFDQDYLAKKEAGFPEEHFRKGHDIFLKGKP